MDLELAVPRRRPFRNFTKPKHLTHSQPCSEQNCIVIECCTPICPASEVWVGCLNRYVRVEKPIAKLLVGCVVEGMNCLAVSGNGDFDEVAVLAALMALNEYRYPQAVVVIKESRMMKDLTNTIKELNAEREALNCVNPTISVVICLYNRLAELPIDYSKITHITMLGAFEVSEIAQVEALRDKQVNNCSLLLLLSNSIDVKAIKTTIHAKFTCISETEKKQFETSLKMQETEPIVSFGHSLTDLYLTLVKYQKVKDLVVYAKREKLDEMNSFILNNFKGIKVEASDIISQKLLTKQTAICFGFRVKISARNCKKVFFFSEQSDNSQTQNLTQSISQSKVFSIDDFLVQGPIQQVSEKKPPSSATQPSFRKKASAATESFAQMTYPAMQFPVSSIELLYNRTWVRLTTQKYYKAPNFVVVMHRDYIKIQIDISMVDRSPLKDPSENYCFLKSKTERIAAFVLKEKLNQKMFSNILAKTATLGQVKITFFESLMVTSESILNYLSSCDFLNMPDCVVLILIVFENDDRFRAALSNITKQ